MHEEAFLAIHFLPRPLYASWVFVVEHISERNHGVERRTFLILKRELSGLNHLVGLQELFLWIIDSEVMDTASNCSVGFVEPLLQLTDISTYFISLEQI